MRAVQDTVFYNFQKNAHLGARFHPIHSKRGIDILYGTGGILTQELQISGDIAACSAIFHIEEEQIMNVMNFLVSIFFCLGALDYFLGNRFGLGKPFLDGLESIIELLILMTGFMVLAPWMGSVLGSLTGPIFRSVGCDPSLIAGIFMSCDGGAAVLADSMALSHEAAQFNGMIVGAFLGITFVFTIPFALTHSQGEKQEAAVKGLLVGIFIIPAGCFITGCLAKLPVTTIMANLWPVALFSAVLLILFLFCRNHIVSVFQKISAFIRGIALAGFGIEVLSETAGLTLLPELTPFQEVFPIITGIGVFLAGILPLMTLIQRILQKPLHTVSGILNIQPDSVVSMILSLANPIPVFLSFDKLDVKGCFLVTAFLTPAGFAVGDHLAFALQYSPDIAIPLMTGKILTGCIAFLLAFFLAPVLLGTPADAHTRTSQACR